MKKEDECKRDEAVMESCVMLAVKVGRQIRKDVAKMPLEKRAKIMRSLLKKEHARFVDDAAEHYAVQEFTKLKKTGYCIKLILNQKQVKVLANPKSKESIYIYLDGIDGTIKVSGLGNESERGIFRIACDGIWAFAAAFTKPTKKQLQDLKIGDFTASVIIDGNPTKYRTYPVDVVAFKTKKSRHASGHQTYDVTERKQKELFTSTIQNLSQSMVYFDSFQAYDKKTAPKSAPAFVQKVRALLSDKNNGGAFDLLRTYSNCGSIIRMMLGWHTKGEWIEPQASGFMVINENLPNMLPAVPIILGAGGLAINWEGSPLEDIPLSKARNNILYAANPVIAHKILKIIEKSKEKQ